MTFYFYVSPDFCKLVNRECNECDFKNCLSRYWKILKQKTMDEYL